MAIEDPKIGMLHNPVIPYPDTLKNIFMDRGHVYKQHYL